MDEDERLLIVNELKLVDNVFLSIDKNQSVELSIKELFNTYNKITIFSLSMVVIKTMIVFQKLKFVKLE